MKNPFIDNQRFQITKERMAELETRLHKPIGVCPKCGHPLSSSTPCGCYREHTAEERDAYAKFIDELFRDLTPLDRDKIEVLATYAPEGISDDQFEDIVRLIEKEHGIESKA